MRRMLLPCLAVLAACGTPDIGHVRMIGHGGLGDGAPYPMNSLPALAGGLAMGLDGIELDVQLTADSVLVAYHAEALEELTACSGKVNAHSYAELKACSVQGTNAIVRVDHLLQALLAKYPNADLTLDCKLFAAGDWWPYLETYTRALARLDNLHPGHLRAECQVDDFLLLLQSKAPELPLYRYGSEAQATMDRAAASHFTGITIEQGRITAEQVKAAHDLGLDVAVFGVGGGRSLRAALRKGADRIQTDAP